MPLVPACAQLTSTTEVRLLPHPDAGARARATTASEVVSRTFTATSEQEGDRLRAVITEHRRCREVMMMPMLRAERTIREVDAGIYWEYGIAALTLGVAAYAFARPEAFARPLYNAEGEIVRDRTSGYVSGGIFSAIGAYSLTAGVIDTVRARDSVTYEDTLERREGPTVACDPPTLPWAERPVALMIGAHEIASTTDRAGRVEFVIPGGLADLAPAEPAEPTGAAAPASAGATPLRASTATAAARRVPAAIRADPDHAIALDLALPDGPGAPSDPGPTP